MSNESCNKSRLALIGSVTLNIFLVAFVLGRMSMGPPPVQEEERIPNGMKHTSSVSPPSSFGPSTMLSPEEAKLEQAKNKENEDKMREIRKQFGAKLKAGSVTHDEVIEHLKQLDELGDSRRRETQTRVADRISSMSVEERETFAEKLSQDKPPPSNEGERSRNSQEKPPEKKRN